MNSQFVKSVLAGIIATIAMTAMMMISAKLGMPKMEPPKMLAKTMGFSVTMGWVMHFMIGIIFALMYTYLFRGWLTKINSIVLKGVTFGIIAFVLAQIGMVIMGSIFPDMPQPQGNMMLIILGSIVGHVLFGVVVTLIVSKSHN